MSKVGLTKDAYKGSPKGVRSVSFEASELPSKEEHWSWRKRGRRNECKTIRNLEYYRKLNELIDSI
jgi:hypothetical protein